MPTLRPAAAALPRAAGAECWSRGPGRERPLGECVSGVCAVLGQTSVTQRHGVLIYPAQVSSLILACGPCPRENP